MQKKKLLVFAAFITVLMFAAPAAAGTFKLFDGKTAADIVVDPGDYKVVRIAADALAGDIQLVTGVKPAVKTSSGKKSKRIVIIGTLEKSALIKKLASGKKLDVSKIRGKWETFVIVAVPKPFPGVESALVVAGSDRRAAAFGAFEVSQRIGVSPWVWWADVRPEKKKSLVVNTDGGVSGPPSVKYRGIFLNDEDFGLKPWSAKTYEPEVGDIGPKSYARIFELLLRLKANHIWPAMHKCTRAFNHYDRNKSVADDYAIVMGSSHCEQMLRNNVDEWKEEEYGQWSYLENKTNLLRYWEERVKANGKFENIYTLGMRALHDNAMPDGKTTAERVAIIDSIIKDQRAMLAKWVNPDPAKVPQVFIPYKEVLEIYRNGLNVPEDVTIMWPDDNFGYIRRLPSPEESRRPGGSGIYYHISYWGSPHDYLWLYTTPPALIWEEMRKAYDYKARNIWIVNVGDLKPQEIGIELFMQMAWDINRWNLGNIDKYLETWAAREFGPAYAAEIAEIMRRYYALNYKRKPEHMGFYDKLSLAANNKDPEFSLYTYGDESQKRLDAFDAIEKRAATLYEKIPAHKKDAYYQLVLYPVAGSAEMNKKHLYAYKSRRYARQNRVSANEYARMSAEAFKAIGEATRIYNEEIAGGKWRGMMLDHPNNLPVFRELMTGKRTPSENPELGVALEGSSSSMKPCAENRKECTLPNFNRFTGASYFMDIFNKGAKPLEWTAAPDADWIVLSKKSGNTQLDERVFVSIDYDRAPDGDAVGKIVITGGGETLTVYVKAFNPKGLDIGGADYVQDNGVVSIEAGGFTSRRDANGAGWRVVPGFGRSGRAMIIDPPTAAAVTDLAVAAKNAPAAEYSFYVFDAGDAVFWAQALPTHEIRADSKLRIGVSIDGGDIVPVDFTQASEESSDTGKINVQRNMMEGKVKLNIGEGYHTLRVWGLDPSVAPDKFIIDFGGMDKSYLGPPTTKTVRKK